MRSEGPKSRLTIFSQFYRSPNFNTKSAGMPGCYRVKCIPWWNWLKIEIWDLQTSYNITAQLVSLDHVSPYPKNVQARRERAPELVD